MLDETTLCVNYISQCFRGEICNIEDILEHNMWVLIDETIDAVGQYICNTVEARGRSFFLNMETSLNKLYYSCEIFE